MKRPDSSRPPHLSPEPHSNVPLDEIIVLSRFPHFFLYHGFPRRAVKPSGIDWLGRGGKKAFPFLVVTSLWFLYVLLITHHDRLSHLFYSSFAVLCGREGEASSPNPSLYFFVIEQRASEQAIIGVLFIFFWSRRALRHFSFFLFSQEASESIFQLPLHKHWEPGVFFSTLLICLPFGLRWLVVFFFLSFDHCFFCSSAD